MSWADAVETIAKTTQEAVTEHAIFLRFAIIASLQTYVCITVSVYPHSSSAVNSRINSLEKFRVRYEQRSRPQGRLLEEPVYSLTS
jgi:hypothetical protein